MFVTKEDITSRFKDKTVAIVGSAPSILNNAPGHIDKYDVVVRCNNYKAGKYFQAEPMKAKATGWRTDVHYSFYGTSIRKTADELQSDGVTLCMAKCPDALCHETEWQMKKDPRNRGGDFRWFYEYRKDFWFCDTYIPTKDTYMKYFNLLNGHVPTTGFAGILEMVDMKPKELYITGFDFFESDLHNVDEVWGDKGKNPDDPIKHVPHIEKQVLRQLYKTVGFITLDNHLRGMM